MELSPQLKQLRDFYYKTALKLPADKNFVHAPGLIDRPAFFTFEHLKTHLNNPLLLPTYFSLYWQGKRIDCTPAVGHKVIQASEAPFLNKGILQEYLANGASMVLEGIDILEPQINAMCAAIDQAGEAVLSNSVVFFSQAKGGEAYRGHLDTSDVLVVHLAGAKKWRIHARQKPRWVDLNELDPAAMGPVEAEIVMRAGDALYLRNYTPHQVATAHDYSMHMAFDICDRKVNADTALHLLLEAYNQDAAACYANEGEILDKLAAHAAAPAYRKTLADLGAAQRENYKRARAMIGSNRVAALDALIAAEARAKA
ncbi:MAG: JmjC domain-containing protein [Burkholderiales bacterium]